uniref:Uncharacterized protein n=1 Tax=Ralstonia solanacearum TaxID=305 RepID=A0A0S4WQ19_RALSL|nr:protein of unknown function [Ralstonia solanacearum]
MDNKPHNKGLHHAITTANYGKD